VKKVGVAWFVMSTIDSMQSAHVPKVIAQG
jgi:hypothetical protein